MSATGRGGRQNHTFAQSNNNNRQAQLATAYQELGKELGSDRLTIVGGYTLGRVIGEGTYGSVHIATHRLTGTRCAIKKIPKTNAAHLTREIHHHRRLHHPSIVHLHEVLATESHIWLVTELCSGGELFDYLVERGRMLEGEARRLFGELTVAVGWMHREGVVHRDLKLENVLLDGELKIKLGDLGFAREWQRGRLMETFCGTTGYASPEMLAGRKYLGVETDIWSLGIILYILLCGGLPFDDDDENVMKDLISKGEYEEPEWLSEEARTLIRGMLQQDPSKRLTVEGILTHPWFKMTIYDNIHENSPQPDLHHSHVPPQHQSSPLAGEAFFSEPFHARAKGLSPNQHLSAHHSVSVPSPLSSAPPTVVSTPALAESEASETSFDFHDSENGRPDSGVTTPTTAEEEEDKPDSRGIERSHSGEFSQTEKTLELLHANESQSTIRRPSESPNSTAGGANGKGKLAVKGSLEGQREEDEEGLNESFDRSGSLPILDEHSLHLPVALHSRTPSRTKRRSVSSTLSLERRHSYQNTAHYHTFPPEDYLAQLSEQRPEPFSTPSEKYLLNQLSDLGIDTGQLVHSVTSDACDASAATWWILRQKQAERGETDEVVQARNASAARRRDRAAAYAREERRKAKAAKAEHGQESVGGTDGKESAVKFNDATTSIAAPQTPSFTFVNLGPPVPTGGGNVGKVNGSSILPQATTFTASPETVNLNRLAPNPGDGNASSAMRSPAESDKPLPSTPGIRPEQPIMVPLSREGSDSKLITSVLPQTPPRERRPELANSPGDRTGKTRSPSFSMLQRATSAFVGSGKKEERDKSAQPGTDGDKSITGTVTPAVENKDERKSHSPTKLTKLPPKSKMAKSESEASLLNTKLSGLTLSIGNTPSSTSSRSPEISVANQQNPMDSVSNATLRTSPPRPTTTVSPSPSKENNAVAGPGPSTMDTFSSSGSAGKLNKAGKRDSLWTTFRYLFNEDKRRRKRDRSGLPFDTVPGFAANSVSEVKVSPALVLSRGISGRNPHATRLAATPVSSSRKASLDTTRPGMYSRRSSSVNSRRSSVNSIHLPADFANHLQRVQSHSSANHEIMPPPMKRRTSERSNGSQTPTSDREYGSSRPSSAQSLSLSHQNSLSQGAFPISRRSSTATGGPLHIRSPSLQSDSSGRFKSSAPASPLHNYHRRATSGSASTRVRHIKVIHETQILRSASQASSIRSNASSRASSVDRKRDRDRDIHDSDYDTGREDNVSLRSMTKRKSNDISNYHPHHYSLAHQIHRTRSPLAVPGQSGSEKSFKQSQSHHHGSSLKPKQPLRDVFQQKDDEWVSDDDEGGSTNPKFAGGLGQSSSRMSSSNSHSLSATVNPAKWVNGARVPATQHPSTMSSPHMGGRRVSSGKGREKRGRSRRGSDEEDLSGDSGFTRLSSTAGGNTNVGLGVGMSTSYAGIAGGTGERLGKGGKHGDKESSGGGGISGSSGDGGRGRRTGIQNSRSVVPGIVEEDEEEE